MTDLSGPGSHHEVWVVDSAYDGDTGYQCAACLPPPTEKMTDFSGPGSLHEIWVMDSAYDVDTGY